jgi:hypothetical protein
MSDNWQLHRNLFTQEQFESLEDVVSLASLLRIRATLSY